MKRLLIAFGLVCAPATASSRQRGGATPRKLDIGVSFSF